MHAHRTCRTGNGWMEGGDARDARAAAELAEQSCAQIGAAFGPRASGGSGVCLPCLPCNSQTDCQKLRVVCGPDVGVASHGTSTGPLHLSTPSQNRVSARIDVGT